MATPNQVAFSTAIFICTLLGDFVPITDVIFCGLHQKQRQKEAQ
jgi:hypothetical protein